MSFEASSWEILLAEDSAADVTLVREALKEHDVGCVLHVVKDGADAIAFIKSLDDGPKQRRLDLLLLDMHLPKHDGEDILKALRSTERYGQTPVVAMTSSASPQVRAQAERHAALHYFKKPSTLEEFMELGGIVRDILTSRSPGSPLRTGD